VPIVPNQKKKNYYCSFLASIILVFLIFFKQLFF
jgi:hypothetical protein